MEYIRVTKENLEKEHICCAISNNKDIQVSSKKAWLADRFDEGLVLLVFIGAGMIKESKEEEHVNADMDIKSMFILAVATSIDALAVGVTFAFLKVEIVSAVSFIGVITFVCSAAGVKIGSLFGMKYKSKAELCGGIILILIGTKILLEGLGMI